MLKRPDKNESEEDLLRFQEEFFSSKAKPSVVVKKVKKNERDVKKYEKDIVDITDMDVEQIINKPAQHTERRFHLKDEDMDAARRLDEKDKEHILQVLTNIQERETKSFTRFQANCYKNGFPEAPILNKQFVNRKSNEKQKKSLFAKQFPSFNAKCDFGEKEMEHTVKRDIVLPHGGFGYAVDTMGESAQKSTKSEITVPFKEMNISKEAASSSEFHQSDGIDKANIHEENVQKLQEMSEKEILEEQKKLFSTLDPKVVECLKNKSKANKLICKTSDIGLKTSQSSKSDLQAPTCNVCISDNSNHSTQSDITSNNENVSEKGNTEIKVNSDEVDPYKEFAINKSFVNMDEVEKEKLIWMKEVPKVGSKKDNIKPRFDFEGRLVSFDSTLPMNIGLHHHGEEPGSPGYTLEELFGMIRSNFPQQRIFALKTLGCIIEKYHQQNFSGKLSGDLLSQCLDAGLIFILRWSIDEQSEQIYSAAVAALAYVVYIKSDQDTIDNLLHTEKGYQVPSLCTYFKKQKQDMTQEELEEERDLTDAELLQVDVIKGLVQMQILPRLRYVMEICHPSDFAVKNCLFILIRMAQHHIETAYDVFKTPRLIDVVFENLKRVNSNETIVYCLKLVRCICQAGKHMAAKLLATYSLDNVITTNFTQMINMDNQDEISVEIYEQTCQVWRILLMHGLSTDLVRDLYPVIMDQLQLLASKYSSLRDKCISSLIHVIEAAINVSSQEHDKWSLIEGLFPLLFHIVKSVHKDLFIQKKVTQPFFLSALLRCCGSYFAHKNSLVSEVNPVTLLDDVVEFWTEILQPILDSPFLTELLDEMRMFSDFKASTSDHEIVMLENLPSYGVSTICNDNTSLANNSPIILVQALIKLVVQLTKINKSLIPKTLSFLLVPETMLYIRFILESKQLKLCSTLVTTRIEILTISYILKLFYNAGTLLGFAKFGLNVVNSYQEMTFRLLCIVQPGDHSIARSLMKDIIFNPNVFRKQNYILWLTDENIKTQIKEQLTAAKQSLKHASNMYQGMLFDETKMKHDKKSSFLLISRMNKVLPSDWVFYPIVNAYSLSLNVELSGSLILNASNQTITILKDCLQFILLLETVRPSLLADVSETMRFTRFMCVFLMEGEVFKEESLKLLLLLLIHIYSAPTFQSYVNFSSDIPGITSFYDLYCNLTKQYLASSFGDSTFANVVLLPMQLQHHVKYRRAIWGEYCEVLRVFPLPLTQVTCDIKNFLAAKVEDNEMISLYFNSLISLKVRSTWCPLFYLIALHHVNQFIFNTDHLDEENSKLRTTMLISLLDIKDEATKEDAILYKCYDVNVVKGFCKFTELPPSRQLLLRNVNS